MVVCEYCKNEFSTKNSMETHQKRTKYCIKIQQQNKLNDQTSKFNCLYCDKDFFRKDDYYRHEERCKLKMKKNDNLNNNEIALLYQEIRDLKEKNLELEKKVAVLEKSESIYKQLHMKKDDCVEKIALQPKTTKTSSTQNNILNNLPIFNLTKEKLQLIASTEFTHELFLRGQEGAAKFATNIARKENDGDLPWVVSDKNRGIVKMKGEDGIIITDYDVEIITELVFEAIKDKNQEYFDAAYPPYDTDAEELDPDEAERVEANKARADKCFSDIAKMRRNNKVFKKKLIEYSL